MSTDVARRLAQELTRRGLATPARLLADAHRPMSPLLSDLGAALGPLLGATGVRSADDLGSFLQEPDALDRLVTELDAAGGRHGESR